MTNSNIFIFVLKQRSWIKLETIKRGHNLCFRVQNGKLMYNESRGSLLLRILPGSTVKVHSQWRLVLNPKVD